jgi:hypothetical protein
VHSRAACLMSKLFFYIKKKTRFQFILETRSFF